MEVIQLKFWIKFNKNKFSTFKKIEVKTTNNNFYPKWRHNIGKR